MVELYLDSPIRHGMAKAVRYICHIRPARDVSTPLAYIDTSGRGEGERRCSPSTSLSFTSEQNGRYDWQLFQV
jgi:hypothetical protein